MPNNVKAFELREELQEVGVISMVATTDVVMEVLNITSELRTSVKE